MTRIVAGTAGGRSLRVPPKGTRPTSDKVREALFSRLEHFDVVDGARVLDLYAGSGALGLEAASRGAAHVTLVDSARQAVDVCRHNVRELALPAVDVVLDRVERFVAAPPVAAWDLVLLDPPYDVPEDVVDAVLEALAAPGVLSAGAIVVVERSKRSAAQTWPGSWEALTHKDYGDTSVWLAGPAEDDAPA